MNEEKTQLEVSNTAAVCQYQTIYSHYPAVTIIKSHITHKYMQTIKLTELSRFNFAVK